MPTDPERRFFLLRLVHARATTLQLFFLISPKELASLSRDHYYHSTYPKNDLKIPLAPFSKGGTLRQNSGQASRVTPQQSTGK